jgi:hypothetical protein
MRMVDPGMHNLRHNRSCRQSAFAVIVLLSIATAWTVVLQHPLDCQAQASFTSLPPITLTIVGANGTQVVLHETEIGSLQSYRAYGGYKNQLGYVKGLGYYTGVPFTTLCDIVGGMQAGDTLRVTASDNYTKDFTYSEVVLGEFVTYDPSTGNEVPHYQPLVPIMAYYYNDLNITDGPLRVAVVGQEGLVTNSTYWVKYSIKMEILAGSSGSVGGLLVPTDKVAPPANLGVYAAAVCLVVFPVITFIAVRRKYSKVSNNDQKCRNE